MPPPTLPDPRTTPVPPEWQGRQDPIAAVGHSVPHRVVPQLLRPVLAAPLPPSSIPIRTLHDAACCVTSICRVDFRARWSVKSELAVLPSLKKLDTLLLSGIGKACASDFDPLCSPALRGITTLDLSHSIHIDGTVLSRVKRLSNLRQLLCRRCSALTSSSLEQLAPLQQLRSLNLSSSKSAVTDVGLKNVALLKGLAELDIGYNGRVVDASGLRHLASLPQLRSLCVDGCTNIDTAAMSAIASIPALEQLSAVHCSGLSPANVALRVLAQKKSDPSDDDGKRPLLSLRFSAFPDALWHNSGEEGYAEDGAVLEEIPKLSNLTTLWLTVRNVKPPHFAMLAQLTRLTDLTLHDCSGFTDACFEAVATSCPGLTSLTVTECEPVEDGDAAEFTASMPRLTKLLLHGNGLEDEY